MNLVSKIVLDIVAPPICEICKLEGSGLCNACLFSIEPLSREACYRCNAFSKDSYTCLFCRPKTPLKAVFSAGLHEGHLKTLIQAYKFSNKRHLAKDLAGMIDQNLPFLPEGTLITYVPTAAKRIRARGFDHARLLARTLAQKRQLEFNDLLKRTTQARQLGATRDQRKKQQLDAFRIRQTTDLKSQVVLLVDDVVTTGSTLESAARTLKKAGAKTVYAATFVREL